VSLPLLFIVLQHLIEHVLPYPLLEVLLLQPQVIVRVLSSRREQPVGRLKRQDILLEDLPREHLGAATGQGLNPQDVLVGDLTILELAQIVVVLFLLSYKLGGDLLGAVDHMVRVQLVLGVSESLLGHGVLGEDTFYVRGH